MDLRSGIGEITQVSDKKNADVVIKTDCNNLVAMFTGRNKPTTTFMLGGLEIKGNMSSAMMLEKLARHVDSKL